MMEILKIEWHKTWDEPGEGFMELNCDKFFPCIQAKAQKLFPLVRMWCSDEVIAELEQYLIDKESETMQFAKEYARKYSDAVQKVSDLQQMVLSGKYPIGTRLSPDAMDKAKADLKNYKTLKTSYLRTAKSLKADSERYKKNIAALRKGSD